MLVFGGISSHVAPVRGFQDINRELVTCKYRAHKKGIDAWDDFSDHYTQVM